MKTLYLFSGLGADRRAFNALDLSGFDVRHIHWVTPQTEETLGDYARRIAIQINTPDPILIGLSFGGMVALEVAKYIPAEKIILISSAKGTHEIPIYYRWMGTLRLHWLIPSSQINKANGLLYWLFGAENDDERRLLANILADTDPHFFKWAIHHIGLWDNKHVPPNAVHIHGTHDRILPYRFVKADHVIPGGGHLMAVNRAHEVSLAIRRICES